GDELDHLDEAPINAVDFFGEIASGVNQFAFLQVSYMRQFSEGLQLNRPECRAKGEEIATGHEPDYSKSHAGRASNLYISGFRASTALAIRPERVKSGGARLRFGTGRKIFPNLLLSANCIAVQ